MLPDRAELLILLGLLVLQAGLPRPPSIPKALSKQPSRAGCHAIGGPAPALRPGQILACELASGEEHVYRIPLTAGDFLPAQVDQDGIDIIVMLFDPLGRPLLRTDSPNGRRGDEQVQAVAGISGNYRLKLSASAGNWRGAYRLSIGVIHPATEDERVSAAAFQLLTEGDDLKGQQRFGPAAQKYHAAERIWASVNKIQGQILALERLGILSDMQNVKQVALPWYREGLLLAHRSGDRAAEARLANRVASMLVQLDDIREAERLSQRALELAADQKDLREQALAHNNLALALKSLGKVQEVLASYGEAERLLQELREPAQVAQVLCNQGEFLLSVGQSEQALRFFERALAQLEQEDEPRVRLTVLNGAGLAFQELGYSRKALWSYHLALRLAGNPGDRAFILTRLSTVLLENNDLLQAEDALRKGLDLARGLHEPRRVAYALADLAHLQDLLERETKALGLFEEALDILRDLEDPATQASVLFGRAEAERDLGRFHDAITSIETSIRLVESVRSNLASDLRVSFFGLRHRYYELYIDLLMEQHLRNPGAGYDLQAFQASEQSRARSLLDDVIGSKPMAAMSLDEIRRNVLDQDSVLLVFALGKRRSFLWVVTEVSLKAYVLPKQAEIDAAALAVWRGLSSKRSARTEVRYLSGILFSGVTEPLASKPLLVSPDGALHLVPFSALCDPAVRGGCGQKSLRPLIMDHEIVVLPSASVIAGMRHKLASRKPAPKLLSIIADPVFQWGDDPGEDLPGGRLLPLHYTRKEADKILKLVSPKPSYQAFEFEASRDAAMSPGFLASQILHIATHNLPADHPDFNGLVFSRYDKAGRARNGFLRAREIADLKLSAELVVLSACGTGLGRDVRGEGPMGLTRAFLHAGAKRVVVSLWNVRDEETSTLMARFYEGMLRDNLSPAAALRKAQISLASRPPRSWAGFVLQGEPR